MKKIISLLLLAVLLTTAFIGCGSGDINDPDDPKDPFYPGNGGGSLPISGTDAAKLLLAEERLNEKLLKNEGDIFEKGVQTMKLLATKALENLGVTTLDAQRRDAATSPLSGYYPGSSVSALGLSSNGGAAVTPLDAPSGAVADIIPLDSFGEEKTDIGKMTVVGDTVEWTELDEVSNSYEYFLNLTANIVSEAEMCADLINFVKKNIRIVDKWVDLSGDRYYLSVGENEELLCNESGSGADHSLTICRRYRNAEGKDVYEMYRSYGSETERRMTYIPGERYELSEGRIQHFIATNTKGYWENYVLGDVEGSHYNVSYLIMKDDICYTFGPIGEYVAIDILSADRQTDLFLYMPSEFATSMILKLNGFTNIEKITADKSNVQFDPGNDYGILQWGAGGKIHLKSGVVLESHQQFCGGKVFVDGILVMAYAYGYGAELMLTIEGSPEEATELFKQFLQETGLGCSRDIDTVMEGTKKSITDSRAVYNYYQWNGFVVNKNENIRQATVVEKAKYDEIRALYESVKYTETIIFNGMSPEELQLLMSFAPIVESVSGGAKMAEGKLTVDTLTLAVDDVTLFVKDEPYRVVLALEDSAGSIVHLEQTSSGEVKYAGEKKFSVTVSGVEITLPHLTPGSYRVVAYIATADGIRSSKFTSVSFNAADEQPVNLGDTDLSGSIGADGALTLTYTERVDVYVKVEFETAPAFDAFKQTVCEQAFLYGTPDESKIEMLQGESYVALTGTETKIAEGIYRIGYTVENGSYTLSGYVYVAFSEAIAQNGQPTAA